MTARESLSILVGIAEGEVGVREEGGNNRGGRIRVYQAATWLQPDPWPWCAAFVCWCVREWLRHPGVSHQLGIQDVEKWRPKTAGAFDFARWAREKGLRILPEQAEVKAGDLVIFDFSHIGIVVNGALSGSQFIETVEGNTNGKGERDSESGDGVWRKKRARHLAKQFIRLTE
jgi:hypothetical protein